MHSAVRPLGRDQLAEFMRPVHTALGLQLIPERIEQVKTLPELALCLGGFIDDQLVGAAGVYSLELTVPGGAAVPTAGLTMVGVLPTHRRRGVLSQLMRHHLAEAHRCGQPLASLFASEGSIYNRFGYSIASLAAEIELDRAHTAFVPTAPKVAASARLLDEDEAVAAFPAIWDRVRARTPGMVARSPQWWRVRRLGDPPWVRGSRAPLQRVLLQVAGEAVAYAIYRQLDSGWDGFNINTMNLEVVEAVGDGPAATAAVWRYLLDIDLAQQIKARLLPVDHPLLFLLVEPRRLRLRLSDALWVRVVEVTAALGARSYAPGPPLVFAVSDPLCPWNQGTFCLHEGVARRSEAAPELQLPIEALGAVYLGGFRFSQLAAAGRIVELRPGAVQRADALFATATAPWAPEIF
jgi:predicted acetyltransferase